MSHCARGVEKGMKGANGKPIEVMGLLTGRPSTLDPQTVIITNSYPLPIEGFETRVIADDQAVINYMIRLQEMLEKTTTDLICGWYHSHPFDVGSFNHCFLSSTDLTTQLQWQRAEDGHGNPWVGVVVDPLRTEAKKTLEMETFRALPPDYENENPHQCPDGRIIHDEKDRLEKWGVCFNRSVGGVWRWIELRIEMQQAAACFCCHLLVAD